MQALSTTFAHPTADLNINKIVRLNVKISFVNCSRRHGALDLEMKYVPFHETRGSHTV